ncbi:MAG: endonuclease domain-containing protein [Geodermatophilaceae bacterium]
MLHGVYVPAGTVIDHGIRCLAAALILSEGAVLTGHSAAWWYSVEYARADALVMAAMPPGARVDGPRGVKVHRTPVEESDVCLVDAMRVTSPGRACWDVATLSDVPSAVATVDGMLHRGVVTPVELRSRLAAGAGIWGVRRVREVFDLADGRSESPPESEVRLLMHRAGIPEPIPQFEVRLAGRFIARVDFAWPERRVILEYDGGHHADQLQMRRDRSRLNDLVTAGWVVLHATAADLHDPSRMLHSLRAALTRPAA